MKINLKSTFEKFNYLPWDQPRHFAGVTSARLNELVKFGLGIQSLGVHSQPYKKENIYFHAHVSWIDTVQDFLIKLGIKPHLHLWEVGILSLNSVIVRPTKIMNRADKNWAHF